MAPAIAEPFDELSRPLKRPRKDSRVSTDEGQPVDHIFIAESLVTAKKPAGKKTILSCQECRRLKLKCDRTFPCGSCKKRGVSDICPEGVLVSGKGTRFVLANTEQLHGKIHDMSGRIRQLEEALQSFQPSHPLLNSESLSVKSTMALYSGSQETNRPSSSSSSCDRDLEMNHCPPRQSEVDSSQFSRYPKQAMVAEVIRLSNEFPLGHPQEPNIELRDYMRSQLPSREEAHYLWEQAKENALWQYNPHPTETFFPNLAHHCYTTPIEDLCSRRLALIFMIFAIGCLVDLGRPPDSPDAEHYHTVARAALCEINIMEDTTVETITALFYEIWYLLVFSDKKKAVGYAWGLMGLTAKLAQGIGLHRHGRVGKVIPEELEKRRCLLYELLYLDARLSLSLGRPPSLSLAYIDCPRPSYSPVSGFEPSESLLYQEWKHSCYIHCLAPVLDAISRPDLDYDTVLALDKRIRDFSIPVPIKNGNANSRSLIMQKGSLATALEAVLLQLHRTFFTRAVSNPELSFNRSHPYAPSVVAIFLSASRMIATIQDLYHREPELTSRILGYWSNAFSATVAICLLVSRAPFTCLTAAALQELERARALFNSAKDICPRAMAVIPVLETMVGKANDIYTRWSNGQDVPTVILRHTDDYLDPQIHATPTERDNGTDSFDLCHRSLTQCVAEAHERAKLLFPKRKPCTCSTRTSCPPSHSWAPPPKLSPGSPVLPELYLSNLSRAVVACGGSTVPPLSPTSKFAVVDTLNFELGALNPSTDQSWMAWF